MDTKPQYMRYTEYFGINIWSAFVENALDNAPILVLASILQCKECIAEYLAKEVRENEDARWAVSTRQISVYG